MAAPLRHRGRIVTCEPADGSADRASCLKLLLGGIRLEVAHAELVEQQLDNAGACAGIASGCRDKAEGASQLGRVGNDSANRAGILRARQFDHVGASFLPIRFRCISMLLDPTVAAWAERQWS